MVANKRCLFCGGELGEVLFENVRDHRGISPKAWTFRKCRKCSSAVLDPMPTLDELLEAYPPVYHVEQVPQTHWIHRVQYRLETLLFYEPTDSSFPANPAAVAFTLRVASEAKVDFLTFDGAGGGTGMSPVPMMHECSTPTLYLAAQVLKGAQILKSKGKYVPGMAIAGGIIDETQIFKAIAMSNFGDGPFFKAVAMARSPITAVMKADYFARLAEADDLPHKFADLYGKKPEQFFVSYYELKEKYGDAVGKEIPWSAVGLYTYFINRIGTGLKQLMAGNRKFKLDLLSRSDLASLTERCERVTGIPTIDKKDEELFEAILDYESDAVVV